MYPSISDFKENEHNYIRELPDQHKIRISMTSHVYYIDVKDIVRIQSISNYSKIFLTSGKSMIVSKVLAHFDELLEDFHFVRIHRTHLVNQLYIKGYRGGTATKIDLSNNEVLPVSRGKKKAVQHLMRMFCLS